MHENFCRVYELPPRNMMTDGYTFGGPVPVVFGNVDWFDAQSATQEELKEFILKKRYIKPDKSYLVMTYDFCFTINFERLPYRG